MPKIDFPNISDIADFSPVPEDQYLCCLIDLETDLTKSGDEMWKLRWKIEGGEHDGRLLFDNMVFTPKAISRVKFICICCGLDVSEEMDLDPSMLLDRRALVEAYQEEYEDDKGQKKVRNCIPYDGYDNVPDHEDDAKF